MTCDWCGHDHDVRAICSQRPASRGVSRRSFIALIGAGVAGLALSPSMPVPAFSHREFYGVVNVTSRMIRDAQFDFASAVDFMEQRFRQRMVELMQADLLDQEHRLVFGDSSAITPRGILS